MTLRFLIRGRVQGVGFRYFVFRRATGLGISGWTRNLPDGRVEVVAQGEPAILALLQSDLRIGPSHAQVADVEKLEISDEVVDAKSFDIR